MTRAVMTAHVMAFCRVGGGMVDAREGWRPCTRVEMATTAKGHVDRRGDEYQKHGLGHTRVC